MAFDDKELGMIFPTRTGVVGASEEKRMLDSLGGAGGIRTKIVQNIDGSETMLRTRNGMPEFTVTKKVISPPTNRTFVFRQIGKATGVIANRFSSGMKVLVRDFAIGVVAYWVSKFTTSQQGKWRDVLRASNTDIAINGVATTRTMLNGGSSRLPIVVGSAAPVNCLDDATRSTAFAGYGGVSNPLGVYQAATDGSNAMSVSPTGSYTYDFGDSAGVRINADGDYCYYGCICTVNATYYLNQLTTSWSKIRPTAISPYLAEVGHSSDVTYANWGGQAATFNTPQPNAGPNITISPTYTGSSTTDVTYVGSDLEMRIAAVGGGSIGATSMNVPGSFGGAQGWVYTSFNGTISATNTLTSALLGTLATLDFTFSSDQVMTYAKTNVELNIWSATEATGGSSASYHGVTKDYIYADVEEGVFLTFEVTTDQGANVYLAAIGGSGGGVSGTGNTGAGSIDVKYVLDIRGTKHYFDVYSGSADAGKTFAGFVASVLWQPYMRVPVFSPTWMAQGNCPYIAYTTRAEEAAGATPEFYIDMTLVPRWWRKSVAIVDGVVQFVPHIAFGVALDVLYGAATVFATPYPGDVTNPNVARLFGCDLPFKVQFANGVKGVWQSQLGEGFTGYPSMEITRI